MARPSVTHEARSTEPGEAGSAAPGGDARRRTAQQLRWSIEDPLLAGVPLLFAWLVRTGSWPGVPVVGAAIAALLIIVATVIIGVEQQLAARRTGNSLVGSRQLPRVALVAAAAVLQPVAELGVAIASALALLIIVGGLVLEPALNRAAQSKLIFVHALPGITPIRPARSWLPPLVLWSSLGATALGAVTADPGWLTDHPARTWVWTVGGLVAVVILVGLLLETAGRIRRHRAIERDLAGAVASYRPGFVLYTARPDDASYQVTMWLPYLKRAGIPFLIVTRDELPARVLAGLTDVPIVVRRTIAGLDDVIAPSLRAAFYVNASSGNGALIRYGHLTHVYLGHGDSDKPPSYNPTHAMYDRVFAAGPAAVRRYADHGVRIPEEKFEVVGRPQVEDVTVSEPVEGPGRVAGPETILYAPTWRGHVIETQLSSLNVGEQIVAALLERQRTVIFRPHPFSYEFGDDAVIIARIQRLLADDHARTGRQHVYGPPAESERTILECINDSDAMISDVSGVVSDYLYSGKPFAMVAVPDGDFTAQYPVARGAYVLAGDLANLDQTLDDLLGADPHAEVRAEIRADYLGDFPTDGYADAFVDAIRRVSTADLAEHAGRGLSEPDEPSKPSRRANLRRQLSTVAGGAFTGGLAALSLAAVLLGLPSPVALVPALAALLIIGWMRRSTLRAPSRWFALGGFVAPARILLAAGIGLALPASPIPLLIMIGVVVCVAAEPAIGRGWGRQGLEVANLPSLRAEVTQRLWWQLGWPASMIVILVGWLSWLTEIVGWGGFGGWLALGLAALCLTALCLITTTGAVILAAIRVHRVVAAEERLPQAIADLAPRFAAYFASSVGGRYQLGMWLPYFDRIGEPYLIITRDLKMQREIAQITSVPVVYRPTLGSLEEVIVPSMTTCFYVNNAVKNTHFVERRELTHVWLNHGDSEKPACYNPVHAIYDLIFAAGQAGIDRYARHGVHIPAEKFAIVGRPQVEQIERAERAERAERVVQGARAEDRPTVLYAPTWQGSFADTRVYSLPMGERIVDALLRRGARVIFRAHPFNYRYPIAVELIKKIQSRLAADPGGGHVWGDAAEQRMSVEDCFNASDAMIADVSAVVSDYLHSEKPFAIVSVGRDREALLSDAPAARAAYLIDENLGNLEPVLADLFGADPLRPERAATRIYYLGDFPADRYADGFLDRARAVIHRTSGPALDSRPEPTPKSRAEPVSGSGAEQAVESRAEPVEAHPSTGSGRGTIDHA